MTVVERLQMLLLAYSELSGLVSGAKNYAQIHNLFSVVLELNTHFHSYKLVSEINTLSKKIHSLKVDVTNSIFDDFDALVQEHPAKQKDQYLYACKILEILGELYKNKLIEWFCANQLLEIKSVFGNIKDEAGSLENVPRRYVFFKKVLRSYEETYRKYFPLSWQVDKQMAIAFCSFNKENIAEIINVIGNSPIGTESTTESLTKTIEFELYLLDYFRKKAAFLIKKVPDLDQKALMENTNFEKTMSVSFEPFLKLWLSSQQGALDSKFLSWTAALMAGQNGDSKAETGLTNVYSSLADLFRYYRSVLSQLLKLSNGPIMKELTYFFDFNLLKYLDILRPGVTLQHDALVAAPMEELALRLGLVINTCDYVITTQDELRETLISLAKEEVKQDLEKVLDDTFEKSKEQYLMVINNALSKIVAKIEIECEMDFREMLNGTWRYVSEVSDYSRYMVNLVKTVNQDLQHVLSDINKSSYNRIILDKLIDLMIEKLTILLVKLKPISETMPSQILFDVALLKSFFKKLPFIKSEKNPVMMSPNFDLSSTNIDQILKSEPEGDSQDERKYNFSISKLYVTRLDSQFLKLEQILKVLMVSGKEHVDLVNNYLMIIQDYDFDNFIKILVLKGVLMQQRAIHSNEKKAIIKFKEIFEKSLMELDVDKSVRNPYISNLVVDPSQLPSHVANQIQNNPIVKFLPPSGSLKNFNSIISQSPLINNSLQSLSPNLSFPFNGSGSPGLTKENLEKNFKELNLKQNLGKFFRN